MFTFGQETPTGRIAKENYQPTDKVLLNYSVIKDVMGSVHKAGCRDIRKDQGAHMAYNLGRFTDTKTALEYFINDELCKLGYGEDYGWTEVVRVFPCAMDESYKSNFKEEPTYLADREEI